MLGTEWEGYSSSKQFLQLKAVSGCKCREGGGGVKWYYTSNLNLHMPYFWSAQLGNSAAALWAQEWGFFSLLYWVFCCLSVPCPSPALKDVEYLWLPCAVMMWLQSSFQLSGRNERLGSLRAVAKKASKQAYFKLFHRSTYCLDWLLIPVSLWRKHIFSHKHGQPHVELQVWKL